MRLVELNLLLRCGSQVAEHHEHAAVLLRIYAKCVRQRAAAGSNLGRQQASKRSWDRVVTVTVVRKGKAA
jgi:hypothetical protein